MYTWATGSARRASVASSASENSSDQSAMTTLDEKLSADVKIEHETGCRMPIAKR